MGILTVTRDSLFDFVSTAIGQTRCIVCCLPSSCYHKTNKTNKQTNFNFLLVFDFQWSYNIQFYIAPTCIKSASKKICDATVQIKPFEKVMS